MAETVKTVATQQPSLDKQLAPYITPTSISYVGLLVLLLILRNSGAKKTTLTDGRFATHREIRQGEIKGKRQIARQKHNQVAIALENLVLPDLQPAVAIVGRSRGGKTRSVIDPALKNSFEQGWSNLVLDVKGNLFTKHAAYAMSLGYQVHIFAPGFSYSGGFNFLKLMRDQNDAKTAEEIAKVIEANFGEPGSRKDNFFSPQGVALLKLVFMLAKASPFPDLVTAWKFLALPDLAGRLAMAQQYDLFSRKDYGLSSWIGEAAMGLRSVAAATETAVGIVGSAVTNFQNMMDVSIIPSLVVTD